MIDPVWFEVAVEALSEAVVANEQDRVIHLYDQINQALIETTGMNVAMFLLLFRNAAAGIAEMVRPVLQQEYDAAGQPLGPSEDGMWQWHQEQAERERGARGEP